MKTDCQIKEEWDAIIGDLNKECGNKFKLIGEERSKAQCWKFFSHVVEAETNKSTGYVACKECHIDYYYVPRNGTSTLNRHVSTCMIDIAKARANMESQMDIPVPQSKSQIS